MSVDWNQLAAVRSPTKFMRQELIAALRQVPEGQTVQLVLDPGTTRALADDLDRADRLDLDFDGVNEMFDKISDQMLVWVAGYVPNPEARRFLSASAARVALSYLADEKLLITTVPQEGGDSQKTD